MAKQQVSGVQQQVTNMLIAKQQPSAHAAAQAAQLATLAHAQGQHCNAFMQHLVALHLHCVNANLTQQQMVALVQGTPPCAATHWPQAMQMLGCKVNGWQIVKA